MDINSIWYSDPLTIKKFQEQLPDYISLAEEIAFILTEKLKENNIKFSSVVHRAKSLESFLEKIKERKKYDAPFEEVTDFAGVRAVYLYLDDLDRIKEVINQEFEVDLNNTSDKSVDQETGELTADKFGYNGVNFIVKLKEKYTGPRYDRLKNLFCEIQVRTISQDVWAIINHDLIYKKESQVPVELRRKVNAISATLEVVDNFFNLIKQDKKKYIERIKAEENFLKQELNNIDTFITFLLTKESDFEQVKLSRNVSNLYSNIIEIGKYKTLEDLNNLLEKAEDLYFNRA
jgi:putative GTP pyrophosphokinase